MRQALLFIAVSIFVAPFMANAAPVQDIEPNDSPDTAQNIDAFFDLTFNALIGDAAFNNTSEVFPHAEIIGLGNNDTYDWYSFEIVTEGSVGIFDIDCAWQNDENECSGSGLSDQFDAFVELFDTDGIRLEDQFLGRDDGSNVFGFGEPQDPGSMGGAFEPERASRDPFFVYRFNQPGRYFVRVGAFAGYTDPSEAPGTSFSGPAEGDYLLHVSIIVEDDDGDGVVNDLDLCDGTAPGDLVDPAGCSDAQVDGDGDGVCDPDAETPGPSMCQGSDSCPDTADGVAVNASGCPVNDILGSVADGIKAAMRNANKKARKSLYKAGKKLHQARTKIARGKIKEGLKKLKNVVKELKKAQKEGAHVGNLIHDLVEYARATANAAIAASHDQHDIAKAKKEMAKAEKALRKGKPAKAIEHFAKAWEKVS